MNNNYYPDRSKFKRLAKKGNLIPVYRELLADFETPVTAFCKIDNSSYSFLFESVEGQVKVGRYSFLGSDPEVIIKSKNNEMTIIRKGKKQERKIVDNPFDELKKIMSEYKFVKIRGIPRFCGGLVGYLGYDMVRFIEDIPETTRDSLNLADSYLMLAETILIFDNVTKTLKVISNAYIKDKDIDPAYKRGIRRIEEKIRLLKRGNIQRKTLVERRRNQKRRFKS
ncbi:MAG TPA: anthranilate synthase component I, partial [Candidatus Omnitrophica bacterium]|nr:anthranilate synthase component I [Candidatus Omnitrophota bacterium]